MFGNIYIDYFCDYFKKVVEVLIDIHCHILPSVDDGAENISESVQMAKEAIRQGINTIIATPHHKNGSYVNNKATIIEEVNKLNIVLKEEAIPLTILPGQETRIYGEMVEDIDLAHIMTLNDTQYLFVELPSSHVPQYTEQILFNIQLKGMTPVIVHPERNRQIMESPDTLYELVSKGALTQVTASSIAGYFGKKIAKFSCQLLEANLTHFIASDAHNTSGRSFKMREAIDVIYSKYGIDMVDYLLENANLLIQDKNIYREQPEKIKRKKILGIF